MVIAHVPLSGYGRPAVPVSARADFPVIVAVRNNANARPVFSVAGKMSDMLFDSCGSSC